MSDILSEALARNDRFLREFVEAFDLCPFARRCRETGGLERRVLLNATETTAALSDLAASTFNHIEVALLIYPRFRGDAAAFERFATSVREAHPVEQTGFHVVGFHPEAPLDAQSPSRLVSFLRRSPDPTLQFVRASVLQRVRGRLTNETVWMDPADLNAVPPTSGPSLSDRIAEQNFETIHRIGADTLRLLLANFRG